MIVLNLFQPLSPSVFCTSDITTKCILAEDFVIEIGDINSPDEIIIMNKGRQKYDKIELEP